MRRAIWILVVALALAVLALMFTLPTPDNPSEGVANTRTYRS